MSEHEHDHQQGGQSSDEPVESGALEEEDDLDAEEGSGDGADEGERDESLGDE